MIDIIIFDKDDNLLEILDNNEILNYKHEKCGGAESIFTFKLNNKNNLIKKYNKAGFIENDELQLFIIDDVSEYNNLDENTITATCIDDITTLGNRIIEDKRVTNGKADVALSKALENTSYKVGIVENFDNKDINFYFISSLTALNNILETYNCEFKTRIIIDSTGKISNKYIDLVHHLGEDTGLRFTYDVNLNYIERTIADDNHFNVLYGRGKSSETDDGGYSRKLTFADVSWNIPTHPVDKPFGQKYIEDAESISKYGRLEGVYENDNIEDAEILLQATYAKLQDVKDIKYSYIISVDDLEGFEGFEHYSYAFGDTIIVADEDENIVVTARIIKISKEVDLEEDIEETTITLGNFRNGLVETDTIDDVISSIKDKIENVTSDVSDSDFPNTLPDVPTLSGQSFFANISLNWTYENKLYYTYELYASKIKDFNPDRTNKIFEGKASSFTHETNCDETWYYRVRAKNTHGVYTEYSRELQVSTFKIEDGTEFFKSAAIQDSLIGTLKLDRGWVGKLTGDLIEAKELKVTDGNNNITFYIDSFGRVYLDVTSLTIDSKDVATEDFTKNEIKITKDEFTRKIEDYKANTSVNYILNSNFENNLEHWNIWNGLGANAGVWEGDRPSWIHFGEGIGIFCANDDKYIELQSNLISSTQHDEWTFSIYADMESNVKGCTIAVKEKNNLGNDLEHYGIYSVLRTTDRQHVKFTVKNSATRYVQLIISHNGSNSSNGGFVIWLNRVQLEKGDLSNWRKALTEGVEKKYLEIKENVEGITKEVGQIKGDYTSKSVFEQKVNEFNFKFENSGGENLISNSDFGGGLQYWNINNIPTINLDPTWLSQNYGKMIMITSNKTTSEGLYQYFNTIPGHVYTVSFYAESDHCVPRSTEIGIEGIRTIDLWYNPYFKRHSFTFIAEKTSYAFIAYITGATGSIYIGRIMVTQGNALQEYRKKSDEILSNNTKITTDGVTITHNNGSSTNINAQETSFMDASGKKTIGIKGNGLEFISPSTGAWTSFLKSSLRDEHRGITLAVSGLGHYLALGCSKITDVNSNSWSSSQAITIENRYNGAWWPGLHFWAMNTVDKERSLVHNHTSYIQESGSIYMNGQPIFFDSYGHAYPNWIGKTNNDRLGIFGDNNVVIGTRHGTTNRSAILISEGSDYDYIQSWCPWDMHGYTLSNARVLYSVANLQNKAYTEDTVLKSYDCSTRYIYEDMQIKNNKLILSIPNVYKDCEYAICSIAKKGRGDVWISEEFENYFIIESENDIKVNIEIDIKDKTVMTMDIKQCAKDIEEFIADNIEPVSCEITE